MNERTPNFSSKGMSKNFNEILAQWEQFKKCCNNWLTQVYTKDSTSVTFSGLGTQENPLIAVATGGGTSFELETSGNTGPATFIGGILNIPNYSAASGSTTVPGGSDTSIQYNKAGAFAGDASLTWDYTNKVLNVQGAASFIGDSGNPIIAFFGSGQVPNAVIDLRGTNGDWQLGFDASDNFYLFSNTAAVRVLQMNTANQFLTVYGQTTIQNTLSFSSGFISETYLTINPSVTNNGGILNFNGVLINPTIIATGGTSVINGFQFAPTVTGTPAAMNAFRNTVGNNAFNTTGGVTAIGPNNPVNTTSIFQVYGVSLLSSKVAIGGIQVTPPTASLQFVTGGTAAAGDGQLKLTIDSALKANVENGLFEFDGTHLYFTSGGTRHTIV